MRGTSLIGVGVALGLLAAAATSQAAVIAYDVPSNTASNQFYDGLGLDFTVNSPGISITALGIFNDDDNGGAPFGDTIGASPTAPLIVQIFDVAQPNTPLATATFDSASQGLAINGNNFKAIPTLNLLPGTYSVATFGMGNGIDGNFNSGASGGPPVSQLDDGGGAITFTGSGRFSTPPDPDGGQLPANPDAGPANRYAAGTFLFDAIVPEPASLGLIALAALPLLRRRRQAR